jgi:hypothetical protein
MMGGSPRGRHPPAVEAWAADKTKWKQPSPWRRAASRGIAHSAADLLEDPDVRSHRMFQRVPRPDAEKALLVVGNPIKLSACPEAVTDRWPTLGEHTDKVLRAELGLGEDELSNLRSPRHHRRGRGAFPLSTSRSRSHRFPAATRGWLGGCLGWRRVPRRARREGIRTTSIPLGLAQEDDFRIEWSFASR